MKTKEQIINEICENNVGGWKDIAEEAFEAGQKFTAAPEGIKTADLSQKQKMVNEAKEYASVISGGFTFNDPKKYSIFRDGQDSGFKIAMESPTSPPVV